MATSEEADYLKALATQGRSGIDAFKKLQTDFDSQQQGALGRLSQRAGLVNAPAALIQQQQQQISAPTQSASRLAQTGANTQENYSKAIGGAQSNYMNQLKSVQPLLQQQVNRQASGATARAQQQAQQQQMAQMKEFLTLQRQLQQDQYAAEDRADKTAERDTKQTADAWKKAATQSILNSPRYDDTTKGLVGSIFADHEVDDLPSAIAAIKEASKGKDFKGANLDDALTLAQAYYDPTGLGDMLPEDLMKQKVATQQGVQGAPAAPTTGTISQGSASTPWWQSLIGSSGSESVADKLWKKISGG